MNLSYFTLRRLADELSGVLEGKRIRDAVLLAPFDLYLSFDEGLHLLASADPHSGRVALCSHLPDGRPDRPPWAERYLRGASLEAVDQAPFERILSLSLVKRDRLGGQTRSRIVIEMLGRSRAVVLLGEPEERILSIIRRVSTRSGSKRPLLPGKPYLPPPRFHRQDPVTLSFEALQALFGEHRGTPTDALVRGLSGLDPLAAGEILSRTGIGHGRSPSGADLPRLLEELKAYFEAPPFIEAGGAALYEGAEGGRAISPLELEHAEVRSVRRFATVSEAIEAAAEEEGIGSGQPDLGKALQAAAQKRITFIERRIEKIRADIEEAENADLYEKYGTVLMSNLKRIPPRAESVVLDDLYDADGPPLEIPLRPDRLPVDNAQNYLRRSRKARRGAPILAKRLDASLLELGRAEEWLGRVSESRDAAELQAMEKKLERMGWLPQKRRSGSDRKAGADIHPRRYRTSGGWEVLVGRNNQENDRLTKGAAGDDLFFHAQGYPGSHVILRRSGKPEKPPQRALHEAAGLAAYWSKARASKTVPVNYTEVRYVGKPRNAPPGLVTIRNEKTLFVNPREIARADAAP